MSYYSDWHDGPDPWDDFPYAGALRKDIHCKHCGRNHLHWEYIDSKWTVCDPDGEIHVCKLPKAKGKVLAYNKMKQILKGKIRLKDMV